MLLFIPAARPDPTIEPSRVRTFYGEVGSSVRLDCSLIPGDVYTQYYVQWRSARNDTLKFYESFPPHLNVAPFNLDTERFSINPRNFSLTIRDITLADEAERFVCVLGVEDPLQSTMNLVYTRTENVVLSLSIFSEWGFYVAFDNLTGK